MKLRPALGLLALLLLAGGLRAESDVLVVSKSGVHLAVPGDPYYHLRRIVWSTRHFPQVLSFDRYLNYPEGGQVVWPPAFDWSLAAAARVLAGPEDLAAAERVAARAPAVLGTLAVLGVWWLARRRISPLAGWVAGGLLAVLPNHVLHSQVGQLDHHVAVSLATVALLALAMRLVVAPLPGLRLALLTGVGFGGSLLLWPGMLIHVGLLEAMIVAWVAGAGSRAQAIARARTLAWANLGALVTVAPGSVGHVWSEFGAWSPWVLSNFQPAFFLAAAVTLAAAAVAWARWGATRAGRLGVAAAIGTVGLAVAFLAIPGLGDALGVAAGWFSKSEAFQREVRELEPFYPAVAVSRYSLLILLFPAAWAWLAWRCWRDAAGADRFVLLGLAAAFFGLAALQRRFGNSFSIAFVLVFGACAAEAAPRLAAAFRERRARLVPGLVLSGLLALAVLGSLLAFHGPRQRALARAHADPALARRGPLSLEQRLYEAAGRWLAAASPPTQGWDDPRLQPEYGVLTRWDAGHLVRYRAHRPLVQDNFGVYGGRANYEAAGRYYAAEDEDEAVALLERLGVRYVFADRRGAGRERTYGPRTMTARLAQSYGTATPEAPALRHHRLVWHQRGGTGRSLAPDPPTFSLGVWELVAGARVVGRAAPGNEVEATLRMRTASGRPHRYQARTRAGRDGRWELVLPYPTDRPWSPAMAGEDAYEIRSGDQLRSLEVPEAAVRSGARVAGPELTAARGPAFSNTKSRFRPSWKGRTATRRKPTPSKIGPVSATSKPWCSSKSMPSARRRKISASTIRSTAGWGTVRTTRPPGESSRWQAVAKASGSRTCSSTASAVMQSKAPGSAARSFGNSPRSIRTPPDSHGSATESIPTAPAMRSATASIRLRS